MPDKQSRTQLAMRACKLVYRLRLQQQEVAKELRVSQSTVSRLLDHAWETKLIRFSIRPRRASKFEKDLQQKLAAFGVQTVITEGHTTESVARASAEFFEEKGEDGITVVVDGGRTMGAMVEQLTPGLLTRLTILPSANDPLTGDSETDLSSCRLATRVSEIYPSSVTKYLPMAGTARRAPCVLEARVEELQAIAGGASFVFLGTHPLGELNDVEEAFSWIPFMGHDPQAVLQAARKNKCDTIYGNHGLTAAGNKCGLGPIEKDLRRALDYKHLKLMSQRNDCRIVCVAAGAEKKQDAVRSIVRGRLCNTLVLDNGLAENLLEKPV